MLSPVQVSGAFPITNGNPPTMVARIPPNAECPAVLTVTNRDATATIYLRWIPWNQAGNNTFNVNDAAIQLSPLLAYTWDNPPRGAILVAQSTVNNAILGVDGNWNVSQEAQLT